MRKMAQRGPARSIRLAGEVVPYRPLLLSRTTGGGDGPCTRGSSTNNGTPTSRLQPRTPVRSPPWRDPSRSVAACCAENNLGREVRSTQVLLACETRMSPSHHGQALRASRASKCGMLVHMNLADVGAGRFQKLLRPR